MQEFLVQFAITLITFFIGFLFYRLSLPYRWKLLVFFCILLEGLSLLLFFSGKFSMLFSTSIILSSCYFIQQISYPYKEKYISLFDLSANSFLKSLAIVFNTHLKGFSTLFGFILLFVFLLSEYLLFDGSVSLPGIVIIVTSLFWILYNKIPLKYCDERDIAFITINFLLLITVIPHVSNKFFGLTFISPLFVSALFFWMIYNNISEFYAKERDFVFIFLNILVLLFVAPRIFYDLSSVVGSGEFKGWLDGEGYVNFLLTKPLAGLLSLLGFNVWTSGAFLYYEDLTTNTIHSVWVAKQCSGIYSLGVFSAALISFIIADNKSFDILATMFLFLGIITSYIANLFRMAIIVLVGHYWGDDALIWTHANIGWLIFTIWIALFWSLMLKFLPIKNN